MFYLKMAKCESWEVLRICSEPQSWEVLRTCSEPQSWDALSTSPKGGKAVVDHPAVTVKPTSLIEGL
jgi:hypothetical protein